MTALMRIHSAAEWARMTLRYGDLNRAEGRQEVLDICREVLPASDFDEIESRLRVGRVKATSALVEPLSSPVRPVTAARSTASFGASVGTAE